MGSYHRSLVSVFAEEFGDVEAERLLVAALRDEHAIEHLALV